MVESILSVPDNVQGITTLDKTLFNKTINVPVLLVDITLMNSVMSVCRRYLLKAENFKAIREESAEKKSVYLNPDLVKNFDSFEESDKNLFLEYKIKPIDLIFREVSFTYDNWFAHQIINAVLPPPLSFSAFSIIGKIIHLNLRTELLPYKHLIAQVLLEKTKKCESVVNKISNIENTFRHIELEVLAGDDDLKTVVMENGCKFELDFRTVYWNPRLHEEHHEIISIVNNKDVFYDIFCGIGPFAIPIAKKGCIVLANDLNPEAYKYTLRNKVLNKIGDNLLVTNKDGFQFITEEIKEHMLMCAKTGKYDQSTTHIAMNLPGSAFKFLPAFIGLFTEDEFIFPELNLPIVHFYCFIRDKTTSEKTALNLVQENIKCELSDARVTYVRNVAPNKEMMRVSFRLTKNILINNLKKGREFSDSENHSYKRLKMDDTLC